MKNHNLSIIIVTFNSERHIYSCINSIIISELNNTKLKIIIIDNNSTDKTVNVINKIKHKRKEIFLIENHKNIGFAKAVNQGLKIYSNDQYYLLLNPDTILRKESIILLLECARRNNADICGGTTINTNKEISGSYFRFPNLSVGVFDFTNFRKISLNDKWHKYFYYQDMKSKNNEFLVDVVTGGFMLISNKTIRTIGYLDESFFMYLEDVDYCLRAKHKGLKVFHSNNSVITHIGGASSNNSDKIRHKSWLFSRKIFYIKHFGLLANLLIQIIFLIDDMVIITLKILKR